MNSECRRILNFNAFGWQPCGKNDQYLAFAQIRTELSNAVLEQIKQDSGAVSLEQVDFIGHCFLTVHYSDEYLIEKILNQLLKNGISFLTHNKLEIKFDPNIHDEYSREIEESLAIQEMRSNIKNYNYSFRVQLKGKHAYTHPWNWQTNEGKQFSFELRRLLNCKHLSCNNPQHDYRQWSCFKESQSPKESLESLESHESSEQVETMECMICLDSQANTMVLPCEHCVVCKDCSDKLVFTNDAKICVRCRRPITHVLD